MFTGSIRRSTQPVPKARLCFDWREMEAIILGFSGGLFHCQDRTG